MRMQALVVRTAGPEIEDAIIPEPEGKVIKPAAPKADDMAFDKALPHLNEALMACFGTADAQEGLMAFMQKREPNWTGK